MENKKDTSVLRGLKEKRDKLIKELTSQVYPTMQIVQGETTIPEHLTSIAAHIRNEMVVDYRFEPEAGLKLLELGNTLSKIEAEEHKLKHIYCPVCGEDFGNPLTKQAYEERPPHLQYGRYNTSIMTNGTKYNIYIQMIPTTPDKDAPFMCVKCLTQKLLEKRV